MLIPFLLTILYLGVGWLIIDWSLGKRTLTEMAEEDGDYMEDFSEEDIMFIKDHPDLFEAILRMIPVLIWPLIFTVSLFQTIKSIFDEEE